MSKLQVGEQVSAFETAGVRAGRSFLETLTIGRGPADLLGRFFLAADAGCRERGVVVSFASFDDIVEANKANRDSWKPLFPSYDPAYHTFHDDNSFAFVGRDRTGRVVATTAGVMFKLDGTSYRDFAADLRINYDDPDTMKLPGECCKPTAPSLATMTGNVMFSGAVWVHPDFRRSGLVEITTRILSAYSYTRYPIDYYTAFMVAAPLERGLAKKTNFQHVEWGVDFENSPMGNFSCAFCWTELDYLLGDITEWLGRTRPAQVDAVVGERRA